MYANKPLINHYLRIPRESSRHHGGADSRVTPPRKARLKEILKR